MKVYVIEKGMYSSKFIVGVVESEEEAKQICEVVSDEKYGGKAHYTEYDTEQFKTNLIKYVVDNTYTEWNVKFCEDWEWTEFDHNGVAYADCYVIFAHNQKEAIKIAQDMAAEEFAKKKGVKL